MRSLRIPHPLTAAERRFIHAVRQLEPGAHLLSVIVGDRGIKALMRWNLNGASKLELLDRSRRNDHDKI